MTNAPESIAYTARAHVTGGRDGHGATDDGQLDLALGTPEELGGKGGATNPEQLFAVGYGACFIAALRLAGQMLRLDTSSAEVDVEVGIGKEGQSFGLDVRITVSVAGLEREDAQRAADKAHELCPYSKATRGNIPVEVVVA